MSKELYAILGLITLFGFFFAAGFGVGWLCKKSKDKSNE